MKLLAFVILASMASACALALEGNQSNNNLLNDGESVQPDESDITPAFINSCVFVDLNGTAAGQACFNRANPASISMEDLSCDGHNVYVLYTINTGSQVRKDVSDGCPHSASFPLPSGFFTIKYQACVDLFRIPDVCSNIISDHN